MPHASRLTRRARALSLTARLRRLAFIATFAGLVAAAGFTRLGLATASYAPTVQTDRATYAAGDEISISGQGFAPHDLVTLAPTYENGTTEPVPGFDAFTANADDTGRLDATWSIPAAASLDRRFVITAAGAAAGLARTAVFVRGAAIATLGTAFVAGQPVAITGRDFAAGETVTLQVRHADGGAEPGMNHEAFAVTAAPDGTVWASWTPAADDLAGPHFVVTASGATSGATVPAAFDREGIVEPDKGDYQPGETAVLTGSGFAPGEVVTLQVTHVSGRNDGNGHTPFYVSANGTGGFTAAWYVDPDDSLHEKFLVTAAGQGSGVRASATFWDAGAVTLTSFGTAYTQDFNTLASTGTSSVVPTGWDFVETGTSSNNNGLYAAATGSLNAGDTYSFGAAGSSERALGGLRSGTLVPLIGAQFTNTTGGTITSLAIAYAGEMWRAGVTNRGAADRLDFQLSTDATSLTTGAWSDYNSLDFNSPNISANAGPLDGSGGNRTSVSFTVTNLSIPSGASFWIRWVDFDIPSSDDGLGVDDFSITPNGTTPPPTLSINDVSLSEGNSGTTSFDFTVSLSSPAPAGGVTFDVATANGTAAAASDYTAKSLTGQTIPAGSTSYAFSVLVNGDTTPESAETFFVNVTNLVGAIVLDAQGQGTIANDDSDDAPTVVSTVPANGATEVPLGQNITVTFSEPVNVTGSWFSLWCATSGTKTAAVSGGPTSFTLNPTTDFVYGEQCTLMIDSANVSDQDGFDPPDTMVVNFTAAFQAMIDPCTLPYTPAYQIQGSGATAALTGTRTTQGVVVGDYEGASPALRGFYLQDQTGDGDPATSDAVFVFNGANSNLVSLGDVVRVTGTAGENQGQTQISVGTILKCGTGTVAPTDVTFPVASVDFLERYEGMLVRLPQQMYVTEHFQLGRFGQVVVSSGGRLQQPTNVTTPGAAATALQAQNNLNRIIVDDASQGQNPDPILFARGGQPLSASNTLRGGDSATGIVGVLNFTWAGNAASGNAYRVRPVNALGGFVNFQATNPRPTSAPAVGGDVRVAGMNLLNYFNTFDGLPDNVDNCANGSGGASTDCRGADTQAEFDRQWPKTVAAILKINPDVLAVNELENDGYGAGSAIQDLANRLNAATAVGTWAFVDVDARTGQTNAMGTDAIKVALLYKPSAVTLTGTTAVLNSTAFVNGGDSGPRNRATMAQAFRVNATGGVFIVSPNHLKSKGSACDAPDAADGQGNCNTVRVNAVTTLKDWLATDPTGTGDPDVLIVGDLNSYALENPITTLTGAGFTNLVSSVVGPDAYSYVFDGQWGYLDHALGSASLTAQVTGVGEYHINADEPSVLDYNTDFKTANLIASLYAADEFRVSDHDAIVVGLKPNAPPTVSAGGPYAVTEGQSITVAATGSDPNGDTLTYAWDLDNNGTFETAGQTATFAAPATAAPTVFTIAVRATDPGGLSATASTTVQVTYRWTGFFSPVDNLPVANRVKAGRAIPVKFSLAADKGLSVIASAFTTLASCSDGSAEDDVETTIQAAGGSSLQYDPVTKTYTYVWKTDGSWATQCRLLTVRLADGTAHQALFHFTR